MGKIILRKHPTPSRAAELGVKIFTFCVGTERPPIPLKRNGIVESYKKDFNGEVVITKLNKDILENIVQATGGVYQNGNNTKKFWILFQNN